jgi:ComF family protein
VGAVTENLAAARDSARKLVDPVLALIFPAECPACTRPVSRPTRGPLCDACWAELPRHRGSLCACGLPVSASVARCGRCRRGINPFAQGASLGPYEGSLRVLLHELKYRGRRRLARRLADALVEEPAARGVLEGADALVPVPLHPERRRERGFNQAELISAALSRRTGVALVASALVRRKDTAPQTGLSAAARRGNVRGAFAVRRRPQVAGRCLVLVDDVLTTGATAEACARALVDAGASEVRLLSVARAL